MARASRRTCEPCGGTGVIWSMRSWVTYDGYTRSACGYCDGSGIGGTRLDEAYTKFQRTARERISADRRWTSHEGAGQIGAELDVWGYRAGDTYAEWSARQKAKLSSPRGEAPPSP